MIRLLFIFVFLFLSHLALTPTALSQQSIDDIKGPIGTTPRSDDLPEGRKGVQGGISNAATLDAVVPPTFVKRNSQSAQLNAGLAYSCAAFDPYDNVEQMLNQATETFTELPQSFVLAVQAYIASAPAYLLNKINPTLYNVITKNLDEAFDLFESEYQSCAQLEREIQLGNNPYGQLFKASVARNQSIVIGAEGVTIDQAMESVRLGGASQGIVLENGIAYGGDNQLPVNIHRSLMLAGSNLLLGRSADDLSGFVASGDSPLSASFESPAAMIDFVRTIYGETQYNLVNPAATTTTPGIGYQHEYILIRNQQIELLRQFVRSEITRAIYQAGSGSQIAPDYLKEIRRLSPTEQDIAIDGYARRIAIKQMLEKLDFVVAAVTAGLREPNVASSEAYQVVENEAGRLLVSVQSDIAHLNNARYL